MFKLQISRLLIAISLLASWVAPAQCGPAEDQYAIAADHYSRGNWQFAVDEMKVFLKSHGDNARAGDARFFLAESLVQLSKFDEARTAFLDFLQHAPQHRLARQAQFRTGETAYLIGKYEDAQRDLDRFQKAYPQDALNAYALPYLGEIARRNDEVAKAQMIFQKAMQDYPRGPLLDQCRFGLAQTLQLQGDNQAALRFYKLLAQKPRRPLADKAQLQRGKLYYNLGHFAEAVESLQAFETSFRHSKLRTHAGYWLGKTQMAQRRWTVAVQTLIQTVPDNPQHELAPAVHFALAQALHHSGKLVEADKHYERTSSRWPESEWADDGMQARIQLALELTDHEKVDSLAESFLARYGDSPLAADVRLSVGQSLLKQRKYDQAKAILKELALAMPENSFAWYYYALAQLGQEQYHETIETLDRVKPTAQQKELSDSLLVARSTALIGLEKYAEAVLPVRAYLKSQPNGPDAAQSRARLAIALTKAEKFDEAKVAYKEFVQRHKGDPQVLPTTLYLAETTYSQNQRAWSRELFESLVREGNPPEYIAKGRLGLAWVQLDANAPKESADTFARLLEENPNSSLAPGAGYMRAKALEKLKQFDAALAMYHLVFEKYADSEQSPLALHAAARLHDRLQQDKEAAELFGRLVKEYPQNSQIDTVLYQWAWVLMDLKKQQEAVAAFTQLTEQHRQSRYWADATYRLAEHAMRSKNYRRAAELIETLIASNQQQDIVAHALYLKGQLAATERRWPEVAAPMQQLLDDFAESPLRLPAQYWIAESHYRQGKYQLAGEHFDQLARQTQGHDDIWLAMVPLRQAQVLAHDKKWQEAYDISKTISQRYPRFRQQHEVDYLLGRCESSMAEFDKARLSYERVIRSPIGGRTETAAMAQWMTGETYFHQKRFDDAIKAYHRVERLYDYPRWQAGALLQAGKCHEIQSQWRQAIKLYAQVLKDYGETTFATEASRRLSVARQRAAITGSPK